jgi:oligoendopeptidase F
MAVTWDLSSYFPSFAGPERATFRRELERDLPALAARSAAAGPLTEETRREWIEILALYEAAMVRVHHLRSYLTCLASAHADREEYAREQALVARIATDLKRVDIDFVQALRGVPDGVFEAFVADPSVAEVAHFVRRARERALHAMSPEEERIAADLAVDGILAWDRLYNRITGTMDFEMAWPDGRRERIPISRWRSLLSDPDRSVSGAAYRGGSAAWERQVPVLAAALNAIGGTRLTILRRSRHEHFLDPALFQSGIRRETLEALLAAIRENAEVAREVVRTRARATGRAGIAFHEREAPLQPLPSGKIPWEEAVAMVDRAFSRVYPALANYYREALSRRWIEAEARGGKRMGAFCTNTPLAREERVFMTYAGTLEEVRTLAHEVGHGWHTCLLRDRRPLARHYPMTLAETASTFAEQILAEGVIGDETLPSSLRLAMLDTELTSAVAMLLDIPARFEFERRFHEERSAGEVPPARLKEIMVEAQRSSFGDALLPGGEDPLFWASKLHFFLADVSFYNFPYAFGFLLTRALHARLAEEGSRFLPRYEAFLQASGSAPVEEVLRKTLGEDATDPRFWARSIRTLEAPLARLRREVAAAAPV